MTHMVMVKLSASNYLIWHNQVFPFLSSQKFMTYIDGITPPPSKSTTDSSSSPSPSAEYMK
ncbi:hypothetical protein ACS0TY_011203 [Phlomoides rotata]